VTPSVQEVVDLERALLAPHVRRSPERLEELLDPEFREIGASGRRWTRSAMVAALLESDADGEPVPAEQFHGLEVAPGLVLLTYVSDPTGRAAARSSLWRRSDGRWRLLHHQGTLLAGPEQARGRTGRQDSAVRARQ